MKKQTETDGPHDFNRRDFLKGGSFATLMAMLGGVELVAQPAPEATQYKTTGEKVKCAVIGLGPWGREIVQTLLRIPEADPATICETYATFLRRGSSLAPNAKAVEDYRQILDDKEIKAVIIATPSHRHRDIAINALQAGKHVYCEAPLAATIEDARAIARAARDASKLVFQPGTQLRSDPHRHFLLPFLRSGAIGKSVMARAQWHKKTSWRATSPYPEREKEINWRLNKETSPGLIGEIGIHQIDSVGWLMNMQPVAVTGFSSLILWKDGRDVPDTIQAVFDYPNGARLIYHATLANSFESEYEVYYGSDAAVMMRGPKAWMFKETDSPLLGWEVYASKEVFYKETGIALVADASKFRDREGQPGDFDPFPETPLYYALQNFLVNCTEVSAGVEDFLAAFDPNDKVALQQYLSELKRQPAADYRDGYEATVIALKAHEAIMKGTKLTFDKELFALE